VLLLSLLCSAQIALFHKKLDAIEHIRAPRTFANTVLPLEKAVTEFHHRYTPEIQVSVDDCERAANDENAADFANPTLYAALLKVSPPAKPIDATLTNVWLTTMKRSGATLTPQQRRDLLQNKHVLSRIIDIYNAQAVVSMYEHMAHILGYATWADFVLADRVAKNPMRVEKFLQTSIDLFKPAADAQYQQLKDAFAASQGRRKRAMQPQDVAHAEELLAKRNSVDETQVRQWFPAGATHAKIYSLLAGLFGLSIAPNGEGFTVVDSASKRRLGFAPIPIVQDTTLTQAEIVAAFHTSCDSLRTLLAATPYETLNEHVPADFADAPGEMCEGFAWDATALRQIASDNAAGQPIPDDVINKIVASRSLYNTYEMQQRLKDAQAGGALYVYAPLWARVYADDLFTAFSSGNALDPAIGARFRATILAPAGSLDPDTEVQNFLGRPLSPDAFYKEFTP